MTCKRWLGFVGRAPRIRRVINVGFAWIAWIAFVRSGSLHLRRRARTAMVIIVNDIGSSSAVVLWYSAFPFTEVSK